ncbi:hypothetical protein [Chiayiivirga flava]|uniref:LamG domain-containing protein n=1 Tax=Chiayiivirga flava TaxID=659595 RepID=A0A7W8D7X3_9GAMM|nr:hypothetical protein [Chiayiivirga flava]MBB5207888.1 hypothetical protein [Chiayiivirga flava]
MSPLYRILLSSCLGAVFLLPLEARAALPSKGAQPVATQCSGARSPTRVLRDDFDGTQLDPAVWTVDANAGSVSVAGGLARVAAGDTTSFPFVTAATPLIPASGGFSVRWTATFERVAVHGACSLVGSRGLPIDGGDNPSTTFFAACQDSSVGYLVSVATAIDAPRTIAFQDSSGAELSHDVEVCWLAARTEVWVDGTRVFVSARDPDVPMPDALWFGNYARGLIDSPWNDFSLDSVDITAFDSDGTIFADGLEGAGDGDAG